MKYQHTNPRTDPASARRLAWTLLAVAALMLPMAAGAQAMEDIEAIGPEVGGPVNPDAEARPFNVLTLDASDGSVVESRDNGAPDTTITLVNLPSAEGTYTLRDPERREAFTGAPPTSEMTVAFLYVPLVESSGLPYTVVHKDGEAETQILAFLPTGLPSTPLDPTLLPLEDDVVGIVMPEAYTDALPDPNSIMGVQEIVARKVGLTGPAPAIPELPDAPIPSIPGIDQSSGSASGSGSSGGTSNGKGQAQGTSSGSSSTSGSSQQCWYDRRNGYGETKTVVVGSEVKWTPLNINHAPYGGSSTATASWTKMKGIYLFPGGITSSYETNSKLTLSSGQGGMTKAFFQLARWTQYDKMTCNYNYQWTHGYYVAVSSWTPEGVIVSQVFDIYGASRYTDRDDLQSIIRPSPNSGTTYPSIDFNTRYATADHVHAGVNTFTVSSSRLFTIGASISIGGKFFSFDALKGDVTSGSGHYYEYNMPSGTTRIDYLQGQSNGWAFCTPSLAPC